MRKRLQVTGSDGRLSQWDRGVAAAVGVLACCLFAPVSTWERAHEEQTGAMVRVRRITADLEEALRRAVDNIDNHRYSAVQLIHAVGLVLETLCQSSFALSSIAGDFLGVVEETLAIENLQAASQPVWTDRIVTVYLQQLKASLEQYRARLIRSEDGKAIAIAVMNYQVRKY